MRKNHQYIWYIILYVQWYIYITDIIVFMYQTLLIVWGQSIFSAIALLSRWEISTSIVQFRRLPGGSLGFFFYEQRMSFQRFKLWCEAVACVGEHLCEREQSKWGVRINNYHFFFKLPLGSWRDLPPRMGPHGSRTYHEKIAMWATVRSYYLFFYNWSEKKLRRRWCAFFWQSGMICFLISNLFFF